MKDVSLFDASLPANSLDDEKYEDWKIQYGTDETGFVYGKLWHPQLKDRDSHWGDWGSLTSTKEEKNG
jgi:hypothetical protein